MWMCQTTKNIILLFTLMQAGSSCLLMKKYALKTKRKTLFPTATTSAWKLIMGCSLRQISLNLRATRQVSSDAHASIQDFGLAMPSHAPCQGSSAGNSCTHSWCWFMGSILGMCQQCVNKILCISSRYCSSSLFTFLLPFYVSNLQPKFNHHPITHTIYSGKANFNKGAEICFTHVHLQNCSWACIGFDFCNRQYYHRSKWYHCETLTIKEDNNEQGRHAQEKHWAGRTVAREGVYFQPTG